MLEQAGLTEEEAMANELRYGTTALGEAMTGAARFAAGAGRHGDFTGI
jgi:enoyl-CoA hydratase